MGLRGKMNHRIDFFLTKEPGDKFSVANISTDEPVQGVVLNGSEILEVAGIGEDIQVRYPATGILRHEMIYKVCTDEPGSPCYQDRAGSKRRRHLYLHLRINFPSFSSKRLYRPDGANPGKGEAQHEFAVVRAGHGTIR